MSDRAKQFMPFAALKGYYDYIYEREKVNVPKKELSEDEASVLSAKLAAISKGDVLKVTYYRHGEYVKQHGIVAEVDFTFRKLTLVKTVIEFDDVYDVEKAE